MNGGMLKTGNPGNRGGSGRPPNEIRALCREIGYRGLERLAELEIDDPKTLLDLVNLALRYGVGTKADITSDDKPVLPHMTDEERLARINEIMERGKARMAAAQESVNNP
jgi:hypothetical protein